MKVAFFTAGNRGAGHLVRGDAIDRAFRRIGDRVGTLKHFSPPSPFGATFPHVTSVEVDARALAHPETAPHTALARALLDFDPDLLLIDVFWVPLVFIPLRCPLWLLLRSVPPVWLVGPPQARFDRTRYQRILAIEPAPGLEAFEPWSPIVVANPDEPAPANALRAHLGLNDDEPLNVICQAGLPEDRQALDDVAARTGRGSFHRLDLHEQGAPYPAAPLLAQAEHLVAAPGYNTFWEAQHLGYADRVSWVPIQRQLDDAAWRARLAPPRPRSNGADDLVAAIRRG